MADISSVTFTIRLAYHANVRGRAVRRIFLSDHALKLAKLFAGDVVVLTAASDIYEEQVSALCNQKCGVQYLLYFHLETLRRGDGMAVIRISQ